MGQISDRERRAREKRRLKEEAARYRPRRSFTKRIWQGFWWLVIVGLVLLHSVGGWFYAGKITDAAFAISEESNFDTVESQLAAAGLDTEEVTFQSPLGPMMAWRTFGIKDTWIIHVHGHAGSPIDLLPVMGAFDQAGYPQLAITYRNDPGQPRDPSAVYQYGATEWPDLAAAVDFARGEGAGAIVLVGRSMGASIIFSYILRQQPRAIDGLILVSPSLDMGANIALGASQERLPFDLPIPPTLTAVATFISAVDNNVNIGGMNYLKRAGQIATPTLVIHGDADSTVPMETSRVFATERADFVRLVEVEGAGHDDVFEFDTERVLAEMVGFVNTNAG